MVNNEKKEVSAVEIIVALANMASEGKYDNVTPAQARKMNAIFEAVAQLINQLEDEENNELEQSLQQAQAADDIEAEERAEGEGL